MVMAYLSPERVKHSPGQPPDVRKVSDFPPPRNLGAMPRINPKHPRLELANLVLLLQSQTNIIQAVQQTMAAKLIHLKVKLEVHRPT